MKFLWVILWGCWALIAGFIALMAFFIPNTNIFRMIILGAVSSPIPIVYALNRTLGNFAGLVFLCALVVLVFVVLFLSNFGLPTGLSPT